jgi:pyruvate/2-oxoglutarate/acetoin dehydrogenase E1 component
VGAVLSYFSELTEAMTMLARHPKTLFVGQNMRYDGQRMHASFAGVPMERRIEMPVCEDLQMGFCTGLALEGYIPVCVFPRIDFMLLAANQLVNHLDKMEGFKPKVIIRTAIGSTKPLNPGAQHTQNHTSAFALMLKNIPVEYFWPGVYELALERPGSTLVVEDMEWYGS